MAEHDELVSADVHEPKHISDSTAADSGKVITPLSGGSSELRNLTPGEVGVQFIYGEMQAEDNTTAFAVTAASDATLNTDGDYILVNSTRLPGVTLDQSQGITLDNVNNTLNAPVAGVYRISGWFNITSSVNSSKMGISYTNNGVVAGLKPKGDVKDLGRVQNISAFGLISLSANDKIGVAVACDKSADITILDMNMMLELVEES